MSEEMVLPIAETFHSLQGEGQWVGTPMFFLRLAGCNVGRPFKTLKLAGPFPLLPSGREAVACTSWDGRSFPCDTDYNLAFKNTPEEILARVWEKHICVTGGEPLLHVKAIQELVRLANIKGIQIHVETSGTITPHSTGYKLILPGCWLTCAPKINAQAIMIRRSDELKLLVDEEFDPYQLTPEMVQHPNVFLCPINDINDIITTNLELCMKWVKSFPDWRISFQAHKLLHLR